MYILTPSEYVPKFVMSVLKENFEFKMVRRYQKVSKAQHFTQTKLLSSLELLRLNFSH